MQLAFVCFVNIRLVGKVQFFCLDSCPLSDNLHVIIPGKQMNFSPSRHKKGFPSRPLSFQVEHWSTLSFLTTRGLGVQPQGKYDQTADVTA